MCCPRSCDGTACPSPGETPGSGSAAPGGELPQPDMPGGDRTGSHATRVDGPLSVRETAPLMSHQHRSPWEEREPETPRGCPADRMEPRGLKPNA